MSWATVSLGDICRSISDGDHQAPPKTGEGVPFVTISNITSQNQLDFSNTMFVPQAYYERLDVKRRAQKGDILYSVVGSFGIPVFMRNDAEFVFQRHIAILRPNAKKIVPAYLYYVMLSRDFYMMADAVAIGAAQRTVTLTALRNIEIAVPTMDKQEKIAEILSAYDNLIDNNRRQIALLEEAAQRLYREWFVDLRFPGYENTKIVDGVPEGWTEGVLGDVALFRRGKVITKEQAHEGDIPVVAGGLEPAYYHNQANTAAPVITVSGSGANAGFARLYHVNVFASDCSFVDSEMTPYLYFAYCFVKANKSSLDALQKGAAQPHVYPKDINVLELLVPARDVLDAFCRTVSLYFEKIKTIQRQMKVSTEARDRLLPKLMSGEIAV